MLNLSGSLGLTLVLISAAADAQAFIAAARAWPDGRLALSPSAAAGAWLVAGFVLYIAALRFLTAAGITQPTLQLLCWFGATIVGVAVLSGDLVHWPLPRIAVAAAAVLALGYVLVDGADASSP